MAERACDNRLQADYEYSIAAGEALRKFAGQQTLYSQPLFTPSVHTGGGHEEHEAVERRVRQVRAKVLNEVAGQVRRRLRRHLSAREGANAYWVKLPVCAAGAFGAP